VAAAQTATDRRLVVNIGHDLNLGNLPALISSLPSLAEASIGHELTADALEMGFRRAVLAYKAALQAAG
jgi:pyridoxine 5-phosphate synthase